MPDCLHAIKVYFCDIQNAGDQFNLDLFRHYGFIPGYSPIHLAEVVSTGSILGWVQANYIGAIMGAGFMHADTCHPLNRAAVYAVRGKLSRERVFRRDVIVGDPGLLADQIYKQDVNRPQYALGIIPHFYDFDCPIVQSLAMNDPKNVLLINIRQTPIEVVRQITKCATIASSSLHGLIFANAFNIPSVWMRLSDKVQGDGFKFFDYYSAFNEEPNLIDNSQLDSIPQIVKSAKCPSHDAMNETKQSLHLLYCRIAEIVEEVRLRRKSPMRQVRKIIRNRRAIIWSKKISLFDGASRIGIPPILRWLP